jgi:hypothetical protein
VVVRSQSSNSFPADNITHSSVILLGFPIVVFAIEHSAFVAAIVPVWPVVSAYCLGAARIAAGASIVFWTTSASCCRIALADDLSVRADDPTHRCLRRGADIPAKDSFDDLGGRRKRIWSKPLLLGIAVNCSTQRRSV